MTSPLTGIRILDFTRHQQGPSGTVLLADMGAEVLKIEEPGGEPGRRSGLQPDGFSAYFEAHDRGKKSLVLNMRKPEAIDIVKRLIPSCDVVTENYRPGVMERWGLGYDDLAKLNPRIILASASAWGREGPWANRPGFDHVAQALSGIMVEQGGGPDEEPHALFGGFADQIGGMTLAFGVVNALYAREKTGEGQHVDVSLIGGMTWVQSFSLTRFLRTGNQPGFEFRRAATYTHYRCKDGALHRNRRQLTGHVGALLRRRRAPAQDRPPLRRAVRRFDNKLALVGVLEELFATKTVSEWADAARRSRRAPRAGAEVRGGREAPSVPRKRLHPGDRPRRAR